MASDNSKAKGMNVIPVQRKTTLKWSSNGELSAIDMARILDQLTDRELTECDLTCELESEGQDS